eukprot:8743426-Alexandrium_andersonii.AAC.1
MVGFLPGQTRRFAALRSHSVLLAQRSEFGVFPNALARQCVVSVAVNVCSGIFGVGAQGAGA